MFLGFTLVERSKDCQNANNDNKLLDADTLAECANQCKKRSGCHVFEYGVNHEAGKCYDMGYKATNFYESCPGWEDDSGWNVYQLQGTVSIILS